MHLVKRKSMIKVTFVALFITVSFPIQSMKPCARKRKALQEVQREVVQKKMPWEPIGGWKEEPWKLLNRDTYAYIAQFITQSDSPRTAAQQMKAFLLTCKRASAVLANHECTLMLLHSLVKKYGRNEVSTRNVAETGKSWTTSHSSFGCERIEPPNTKEDGIEWANIFGSLGCFLKAIELLNTPCSIALLAKGFLGFTVASQPGNYSQLEPLAFSPEDIQNRLGLFIHRSMQETDCNYPYAALNLAHRVAFLKVGLPLFKHIEFRRCSDSYFINKLVLVNGGIFDPDKIYHECARANPYFVQLLLDCGVSIAWRNEKNHLHLGGAKGDSLLHTVCKSFKGNKRTFETDFASGVQKSRWNLCIRLLLSRGIDITLRNNAKKTAFKAIGIESHTAQFSQMQKELLKSYPLSHEIIEQEDFVLLQKCIREGQSVNWQDHQGNTLLHLILKYKPVTAVQLSQYLLSCGANIFIKNEADISVNDIIQPMIKNISYPATKDQILAAEIYIGSRLQELFT